MTVTSISTLQRLPLYLRALMQISINGQKMTSSEELDRVSGVSPALIRKDLSLFGGFGKQGSGYLKIPALTTLLVVLGLLAACATPVKPVWNSLTFVKEGRAYPLGGDTCLANIQYAL
jgi:hypothetical protein